MLSRLHIRNYVLIDSLEIHFPEGLVIITGQTGAGKSILLGAIALLTGEKADSSSIAEGADNCIVEAEFKLGDNCPEEIFPILREEDLLSDVEDGTLILRRVVNSSGRSRCFVNDMPAGKEVLRKLSSYLLDIHSQHQSLMLTDRGFQLSILDSFAGNIPLIRECGSVFKELEALRRKRKEAAEMLENILSEKDYNLSRWNELDKAGLKVGEIADLEQEQKELSSAGDIKAQLETAVRILDSIYSLKDASKALSRIKDLTPGIQTLEERIESTRIELEDIKEELERIDSRINLSPNRLESVEERLSALYGLLRKFSCADESELIAERERLNEALFDSEAMQDSISDIDKSIALLQETYDGICMELHSRREKAAADFGKEITSSLHYLELERAVFEIGLNQGAASATGKDTVSFNFSANGRTPSDISLCASGGELSRIMLCLKEMTARFKGIPTQIFDEIDSGVSGSVADKMGSMICRMGSGTQVFSITHLPQVAAKGNAHYVVEKEFKNGKAQSGIREVRGEGRIMELARMLSGEKITEEAVANAKSLLNA